MSVTLDIRTRLFIAAESGGFGVDPDATGAAYLPVRVLGDSLGFVEDKTAILPTLYNTGRAAPSPHEIGVDGGAIAFETPLLGLPVAAGSTVSPGSDDWLDVLLNSALGANVAYAGMAVSASASTTLTTGASTAGAQDLLAVTDAAVNSGRMQWRRTSSAASPYTVHEAWTANPTNTAIAYGIKRWGPLSDPGGFSLSAYYDLDGTGYTLLGGRAVPTKITMMAGQMAKVSWQLQFDSKTTGTKASLPAFAAWTGTPIKGQLATVEWGGTAYQTESVEIDPVIATSDSKSVAGAQGRSNIENLKAFPTIMIKPVFTAGFEVDGRAGTQRQLLVRFGTGALASSIVNSVAFWAENAQITEWKPTKDGNRARQTIKIECRDPGIQTGTTAWRMWQLARA